MCLVFLPYFLPYAIPRSGSIPCVEMRNYRAVVAVLKRPICFPRNVGRIDDFDTISVPHNLCDPAPPKTGRPEKQAAGIFGDVLLCLADTTLVCGLVHWSGKNRAPAGRE